MINPEWENLVKNIHNHYHQDFVPLHEPTFGESELNYVTDCIKTGWVSSVGSYVDGFEKALAEMVGVKRAVAVVNGTAALQIALKVAGVKENDEVIMPSLTFIATANAVTYLQAIPHFVDVTERTLGLDPLKLDMYLSSVGSMQNDVLINKETGRVIRAVVPMHTFGHPVELDELIAVCEKYHLILVEDAAESLGSYYKGKHTASFGKVNAMSFNGNKIVTTGGGGAILTDDEALANYAKHLTTTAKVPHKWAYVHDEIGYNYRMPNLNAALGCGQLEKVEKFVEAKRKLTVFYDDILSKINGVTLFKEPIHTKSNYWLQTILLDDSMNRDEVLTYLNEQGVMSRPIWQPMHTLSMYENCPKGDLTVVESLNKRIINIPSTPLNVGE